jgi:hypothetical protein
VFWIFKCWCLFCVKILCRKGCLGRRIIHMHNSLFSVNCQAFLDEHQALNMPKHERSVVGGLFRGVNGLAVDCGICLFFTRPLRTFPLATLPFRFCFMLECSKLAIRHYCYSKRLGAFQNLVGCSYRIFLFRVLTKITVLYGSHNINSVESRV